MAYDVTAIVGRRHVLDPFASSHRHAVLVQLESDLMMAPLTDKLCEEIHSCGTRPHPILEGFFRLTGDVETLCKELSRRGEIAYFETEYFGGDGHQGAAVWKEGRLIMPPIVEYSMPYHAGLDRRILNLGPINRALSEFGIRSSEEEDAFDRVGLGRHRGSEDFAEELGERPSDGSAPSD